MTDPSAKRPGPVRGPFPGTQPQRTALAWNRTALTAAALVGTTVKTAVDHPQPTTIGCATATAVASLGLFLCGRRRASLEQNARPPSRAVFAAGVACAIACALAAIVLVVVPLG